MIDSDFQSVSQESISQSLSYIKNAEPRVNIPGLLLEQSLELNKNQAHRKFQLQMGVEENAFQKYQRTKPSVLGIVLISLTCGVIVSILLVIVIKFFYAKKSFEDTVVYENSKTTTKETDGVDYLESEIYEAGQES